MFLQALRRVRFIFFGILARVIPNLVRNEGKPGEFVFR